jgi:hypothetical protein
MMDNLKRMQERMRESAARSYAAHVEAAKQQAEESAYGATLKLLASYVGWLDAEPLLRELLIGVDYREPDRVYEAVEKVSERYSPRQKQAFLRAVRSRLTKRKPVAYEDTPFPVDAEDPFAEK